MKIHNLFYVLVLISPLSAEEAFEGKFLMEWVTSPGADRKMKLHESVAYVDPSGQRWKVPAGWVIDGASIPSIFWSLIGPPFVGDYRRASVIHDYYCDVRTESWQKVHRMFYDGCISGGVDKTKAKVMYAAVYAKGPRWKNVEEKTKGLYPNTRTENYRTTVDRKKLEDLLKWIDKNDPALAVLEKKVSGIVSEVGVEADK